jgi:hypothetical protein
MYVCIVDPYVGQQNARSYLIPIRQRSAYIPECSDTCITTEYVSPSGIMELIECRWAFGVKQVLHSKQTDYTGDKVNKTRRGRAIAQAVSRRLPTAAARVQTRVWSCVGFCDGQK